jgi:hypothetical protein
MSGQLDLARGTGFPVIAKRGSGESIPFGQKLVVIVA